MECRKTIKVTGKGQISVKPDLTRITLTLEEKYPEYGDAVSHSSSDTEKLKEILSEEGFEKEDLKTLSFDIDTEYESVSENGIYRQKLIGYRYRHVLKVDFPSDTKRLGKILYTLAHAPVTPEIRISYTVRDREAAKNCLLGKAVEDAKQKAELLAKAAGVGLGEILNIHYSWTEPDFEVRPMSRALMGVNGAMAKASGYDLNLEPDDLELSDTVTLLFAIV